MTVSRGGPPDPYRPLRPAPLDELAAIQTVDVFLPARCGREIRKRCIGKPTEHQAILLHKLGMQLPRNLEMVQL